MPEQPTNGNVRIDRRSLTKIADTIEELGRRTLQSQHLPFIPFQLALNAIAAAEFFRHEMHKQQKKADKEVPVSE